MRRGNRGAVEDFAIGGAAPVKIGAVPAGKTDDLIVRVDLRHIGLAGNLIGFADHGAAAALRDRFSHAHDTRAGRNAILGIDLCLGGFEGARSVVPQPATPIAKASDVDITARSVFVVERVPFRPAVIPYALPFEHSSPSPPRPAIGLPKLSKTKRRTEVRSLTLEHHP